MTLPIPAAALAQHVIALGKTGSGKSSKLRVIVEHLLQGETPVCIIDPKWDWWGLKSSADGKRSGFPLVIFGGEHADVPINEHSGAHVAELVATGNRSYLIDLGGWMVGERTRFFIAYASTLFKLARGARHQVIDEVHNFAPQGKVHDPDAGKMLHWANRLASKGRGKGITLIAASQRPQKVSKDFVTSCETLIACKVLHKLDRDAIKDWVDGCADPTIGKQVVDSLAQLEKPEAWVWSPEVKYGPKLVTWPMFNTYDSFKPQPADAGKLKGWAEVDLDDVKAKLGKVVEEAKANDPKELRLLNGRLAQQIALLEREAQKPRELAVDTQALEQAEERGFNRGLAYGQNLANNIRVAMLRMADANDTMLSCMESIRKQINGDDPGAKFVYNGARAENPDRSGNSRGTSVRSAPSPARPAPRARQIDARAPSNGSLPAALRKVLAVLSTYGECDSGRLALLSGYTYSGGFRNILASLRTSGYIEGENTGTMRITSEGDEALGAFDPLPTGDGLREHWLNFSQFGSAEKDVLRALIDHPRGFDGHALAAHVGREYSGGFRNTLSKLSTAGVLVGKNTGVMTASEELLA